MALRPSWNPLGLDLAYFSSSETVHTTRLCVFNSTRIQKKIKICWAKDNKAVMPSGEWRSGSLKLIIKALRTVQGVMVREWGDGWRVQVQVFFFFLQRKKKRDDSLFRKCASANLSANIQKVSWSKLLASNWGKRFTKNFDRKNFLVCGDENYESRSDWSFLLRAAI